MSQASDKRLIEKLLRLSRSPNPYEADRAREEAERLMRKWGWSYGDFQKDVIIEVKIGPDLVDANLARVVGIARRATAMINRRRGLAYSGKNGAPERAAGLYVLLAESCDVGWKAGCGEKDPGRNVWRRYFWGGFIHAVTGRLKEAEIRPDTLVKEPDPEPTTVNVEEGTPFRVVQTKDEPEEQAAVDQSKQELQEFADRLQDSHSLRIFCKGAYEAGIRLGESVFIPADDATTRDTRRMLDDTEESA